MAKSVTRRHLAGTTMYRCTSLSGMVAAAGACAPASWESGSSSMPPRAVLSALAGMDLDTLPSASMNTGLVMERPAAQLHHATSIMANVSRDARADATTRAAVVTHRGAARGPTWWQK